MVRDGSVIFEANGIRAILNQNPLMADLPEEKCWQMICPNGERYSGDEAMVRHLMTAEDAVGWRKRYAGCST